jgi:hypothetical protein
MEYILNYFGFIMVCNHFEVIKKEEEEKHLFLIH